MPKVATKTSATSKAKAPVIKVKDEDVLKIFGRRIEAEKVHAALFESPLSSTESSTLLRLLEKTGLKTQLTEARRLASQKNAEKLHCVRCHRSYKESRNALHACQQEHEVEYDEAIVPDYSYQYFCLRCGRTGKADNDEGDGVVFKTKRCWDGPHINDVKEIGRDVEVETCSELGCHLGS